MLSRLAGGNPHGCNVGIFLGDEAVARAAALFAIWRNVMDRKLIHVCEVCGKTEILTPEEAFNDGWDYPPKMGTFGIVGPRTCGDCPINLTAWWALMAEKKSLLELSQKQREVIKRIQGEPESIIPKEII